MTCRPLESYYGSKNFKVLKEVEGFNVGPSTIESFNVKPYVITDKIKTIRLGVSNYIKHGLCFWWWFFVSNAGPLASEIFNVGFILQQ